MVCEWDRPVHCKQRFYKNTLEMISKVLNKLLNDKLIVLLCLCPFVLISPCLGEQAQEAAGSFSTLREFTGAPTRVVWIQDLFKNRDVAAKGKHLRLMGYDSEDGKGERAILGGPENFMRPLLTPSGRQVVFSSVTANNVQVVDWSGKNRKVVTEGLAVATLGDPEKDIEWVYVARSPLRKSKGRTFQRLYRVQLDNPGKEELVWDKTVFGEVVHLSGDGKRFSAEIPWPDCAVMDLDKMEPRRFGRGCWPAIAPDQSHRLWFFDGAHRNLEMIDGGKGTQQRIPLTTAPGIKGNEVYHPRWSNHPRYMVMTGPYTIREGGNNIRGGGGGIEIYSGRFNKGYTAVEAWFQVSHNQRADFYPDMWVARSKKDDQDIAADQKKEIDPGPARSESWPLVNDDLLFAWENVNAANEWRSAGENFFQTEIAPEGNGRFALNYQMDLTTGWYRAKRLPEPDLDELSAVQAVSLEFVLTVQGQGDSDDLNLVTLGGENQGETTLKIDGGKLVIEWGRDREKKETVLLGRIPKGMSHLLLELDPEEASISVNGDPKRTYPLSHAPITAWPIVFGDPGGNASHHTEVLLERVSLYARKLNENDNTRLSRLFSHEQEERKAIVPIVVKAELLSASSIPQPSDILPYRRGLVANEYRIVEVLEGEIEAPEILVAHWAILDGQGWPVPEQTVGQVYQMRLDSFDNRPELEGERLSMESDNLLLPMYYDIE